MLSPVSATEPQAPSPSSPPCSDSHAQRKSTDDDCPICQATLASTPLASLVWCKAQCGTNLHRACWVRWEREASSLRGRASLSCVYCRAPWPQPCHHDTTTLPPYSFWSAAAPSSDNDIDDADAAGTPLRTLFNPRHHPWSLWSDAHADAPLPRLFDPRRHARPPRASRLAAADALSVDDDEDDIAASLVRLFNPRDHARADAWSVWGRPVEEALGLAVLHDARRHRRALRCERGRGSRVLEEGGVLEGLFDEGAGVGVEKEKEKETETETETEERRPRRVGSGCRMVYVTVLEDRGVEGEGEGEGRKWRVEGLCEWVGGWACGRW
ncbi:e3 ubiquitin-protein ligase zswim2 [Neofusicoccum parvum]|uniref:E3 ubiquitin-protein ligase zswim2 n=1 Tax=Neofusicoccum parvum TaxID=310453 RepID=A0ACB5S7W6_9PEZI|nr:e3 ubiquitin-protein ligase zswim2 [Neofusicoccum parvum]